MSTYKVTKPQLQNYLLNRSFFHKKAKTIYEVLDFYKCIQVDPINIVGRSHELALWNRVENFKKEDLYTELYKNNSLFEYWLQLYSFIPTKYYPYFHARFNIKNDWQEDYYEKHKKEIDLALEYITEHGPTGSKDLSHIPFEGHLFSWNSNSSRTALLGFLWDTGKIMVCFRKGNQKYYDLTERVIDKNLLNQKVSEKDSIEFMIKSNFDYLGIVRKPLLGRLGYIRKLGVKDLFEEMQKKNKIVELEIPDVKTKYFILESQIEKLEDLSKENLHEGLNILPPLDPFIIDRKLIKDIFDFDYTWEAYVPASKRKFGYYGMPMLYKGKFVGQVEFEKVEGKVRVKRIEKSEISKVFEKVFAEKREEIEDNLSPKGHK
jgi:uncharacterized protein YcaQ